jgi:2-oxoglutarate ferredoxin oxidoreductase subunit alpha
MSSSKKICFLQGNEASAEGAIAAGVNFFAGYPITPATEVAEVLSRRIPQTKGRFIQMEDELACMGAVVGASLAGAKAMTATSGPGFTLLQENIGYAAISEVPCVIVAVQRGGPSTGLPTLPSQSDVMQSRWGTHGDHPVIVYCPNGVSESFNLMIRCFNMAEKYRTPVILLTDAIVGHMRERVEIPPAGEIKLYNRVRPQPGLSGYRPYDATGAAVEGVPPMANIGDGYRHYISGCTHDETGSPKMNSHPVARRLVGRLCDKITKNRDDIVMSESFHTEDADVLVLAYGSVARPAHEAVSKARRSGKRVGFFRPISLWPSPDKEILAAAKNVETVLVPEMNYGQYAGEVCRIFGEAGRAVKVVKLDEIGSEFIHPERIYNAIQEVF